MKRGLIVDNSGQGLNLSGGFSVSAPASAPAPAEPSDALVSGAGTVATNGTYTYRGIASGRNYYNLAGAPDFSVSRSIAWTGSYWAIYDIAANPLYTSADDVDFPWLATFVTADGDEPPPTITES